MLSGFSFAPQGVIPLSTLLSWERIEIELPNCRLFCPWRRLYADLAAAIEQVTP
jgi:hypothetical protein